MLSASFWVLKVSLSPFWEGRLQPLLLLSSQETCGVGCLCSCCYSKYPWAQWQLGKATLQKGLTLPSGKNMQLTLHCQGWLWSTSFFCGIVAYRSLLALCRYQMTSAEQILLPGAVKSPMLTTEASKSWRFLPFMRQQNLAFEKAVVSGFQFLLRHEPCRSLDHAEGRPLPSVFLLQGAVATQNEHVWVLMQYIQCRVYPSGTLDIPVPAHPQNGRWVPLSSRCEQLEAGGLSPTNPYWPFIKFYAITSSFFLFPVCLSPAWSVVVPGV